MSSALCLRGRFEEKELCFVAVTGATWVVSLVVARGEEQQEKKATRSKTRAHCRSARDSRNNHLNSSGSHESSLVTALPRTVGDELKFEVCAKRRAATDKADASRVKLHEQSQAPSGREAAAHRALRICSVSASLKLLLIAFERCALSWLSPSRIFFSSPPLSSPHDERFLLFRLPSFPAWADVSRSLRGRIRVLVVDRFLLVPSAALRSSPQAPTE